MATAKSSSQSNRLMGIGGSQGSGELKQRLMFLILALVVYRIFAHVPVPGVNVAELTKFFKEGKAGVLGMLNLFSGGALSNASVIALGITPYISASIIMQLMTMLVPSLMALQKEGESGRKVITRYTRFGTLGLAMVQSFFIASSLEGYNGGSIVYDPGWNFRITAMISLVTGTMFLMWLGEQITERGLGNGISLLIFAGIVSSLPRGIGTLIEAVNNGEYAVGLVVIAFAILITAFVVLVERGQRRIPINYAKRQVGRQMVGGQSSFLPLKVNMAGVIPAIFASTILLLPATIMNWANAAKYPILGEITSQLSPGRPLYMTLFSVAIVFFCFFYAPLVFNTRETAEGLKKQGAVVPGIRPGEKTTEYLSKIANRLTLVGALYLVLVCLLPEFIIASWGQTFAFGGTSILIIVVVAMDFMEQVRAFGLTQQYESLMKKANVKDSPKGLNHGKR